MSLVAEKEKKAFGDTAVGGFINGGGLGSLINVVSDVVKPKSNTADTNYQFNAPKDEPKTILGLPQYAFYAGLVIVLLMVFLVVRKMMKK
ncbi:hypothetical protein SAMN05421823_11961 [Catalinimonas alkaloidigena]|uniref:Uncharacterized protein n=1 Tax=Catalinimonas alkaloidigena TaxID=1075417 RepID=A0A1G9V9H4_9BACT|nr:hypothetical protein [Catalinimonas alkaloidigena]SDM68858.1 hypothetical protein SAMN05421823_11961 [Catalinimonas alkaloidigena]